MFQLHLEAQTIHPVKGITRSKAWVSKSFVKNWLFPFYRNMAQSSDDSIDIDNTQRSGSQNGIINQIQQLFGDSIFSAYHYPYGIYQCYTSHSGHEVGIQVGIGTAANTALSYKLQTKIEHGITSGKLEYTGGFVGPVTVSGSDSYFDIERIFRNSSGGTITVKEYGIYALQGAPSYYDYPHLIVRDPFSDPGDWVEVDDGEYLKVTYRLLVTV